MISRYSSRKEQIDQSFLNTKLQNAKSYDRIAGYFSSSIVEVAGEAINSVSGKIRIVCNSQLDLLDVETARSAQNAMGHEWRMNAGNKLSDKAKSRLKRLYEFLVEKKIEVRVLPDMAFGLIHGKAGVITLADGSKTSFLGSINESMTTWQLNYELLWEDNSEEAVKWVQTEFDALWNHPKAVQLADAVVEDIQRLSLREVINLNDWKRSPDPAGPVVESPVYRSQFGLWAHQKYFVKLAFEEHTIGREPATCLPIRSAWAKRSSSRLPQC